LLPSIRVTGGLRITRSPAYRPAPKGSASCANGHVPDRRNWRVVGMFHIAETREQARKNVQFGVQAFANYFRYVATFPIIPPEVGDP
jgi:hypothetical protein